MPWQLHLARHQDGGPVHRVGGEDVLAHDVQVGRPPRLDGGAESLLVRGGPGVYGARCGHVVDERVHPHVADVFGVEGEGNAPAHAAPRAGDGEVLERLLEEPEHFVAPHRRDDPVGVGLDVAHQPFLEGAHAEEVVDLLDLAHWPTAVRTGFAAPQVLLRPVALLVDAVPSEVAVLVDVSLVVEPLQEGGDDGDVVGLGGADEAVEGNVEFIPRLAEAARHAVAQLDRGQAAPGGLLGDLGTVFVGAGEEPRLGAGLPVKTGQHVGENRRVGVPDVGLARRVIDRRREIASSAHVRVSWRVSPGEPRTPLF